MEQCSEVWADPVLEWQASKSQVYRLAQCSLCFLTLKQESDRWWFMGSEKLSFSSSSSTCWQNTFVQLLELCDLFSDSTPNFLNVLISYSVKLWLLYEQPKASCAWFTLLNPDSQLWDFFSTDCSAPLYIKSQHEWVRLVSLSQGTHSSMDSQRLRNSLKCIHQENFIKLQAYFRSLFWSLVPWYLKSWVPREFSGVFKQVYLVCWFHYLSLP